jgi:hypothetical protein
LGAVFSFPVCEQDITASEVQMLRGMAGFIKVTERFELLFSSREQVNIYNNVYRLLMPIVNATGRLLNHDLIDVLILNMLACDYHNAEKQKKNQP